MCDCHGLTADYLRLPTTPQVCPVEGWGELYPTVSLVMFR